MPTSAADTSALDHIMTAVAQRRDTCDVSAAMIQPSSGLMWNWKQSGAPEQYFQASVTKLYTTTMALQLRDEGALAFDTPVQEVVGRDVMAGLHTLGGQDHSDAITVEHLLRQNSGLPDYFEDKRADGTVLYREIIERDRAWTREAMFEWVRDMPGHFAPGTPGRGHYSDTNYQLLGMVIEALDGCSYDESLRVRIIDPLGLSKTYLYTHDTHDRFESIAGMKYGKQPVALPLALASFGPDGSVVSTAQESVEFLKAMWTGELFPAATVPELTASWNRIFFPFHYGLGVMKFSAAGWLTFLPNTQYVGHSGASGVVAFYVPSKDLYVTLAANQVKSRSLVYRLMTRLVQKAPTPSTLAHTSSTS